MTRECFTCSVESITNKAVSNVWTGGTKQYKLFRSAVAVVFGLLVFSITLDRQLNCHSYTELIFIPCNY